MPEPFRGLPSGTIRVEPGRHHVTLPRLGTIKTHESTRKLGRRLEACTARSFPLRGFDIHRPGLHEVFIHLVGADQEIVG